jgi:sorbitol-specific phosphotransferase system component IIC
MVFIELYNRSGAVLGSLECPSYEEAMREPYHPLLVELPSINPTALWTWRLIVSADLARVLPQPHIAEAT